MLFRSEAALSESKPNSSVSRDDGSSGSKGYEQSSSILEERPSPILEQAPLPSTQNAACNESEDPQASLMKKLLTCILPKPEIYLIDNYMQTSRYVRLFMYELLAFNSHVFCRIFWEKVSSSYSFNR